MVFVKLYLVEFKHPDPTQIFELSNVLKTVSFDSRVGLESSTFNLAVKYFIDYG